MEQEKPVVKVPSMKNVLDALGIANKSPGSFRTTVNGVEMWVRLSGGSSWSPCYNRVTLHMSVGREKRAVVLHKKEDGMVDPRRHIIEDRPLTEAETAKVKAKFEDMKGKAVAMEQERQRSMERQRKEQEYDRAVAEALPERYTVDDDSSYPIRKWEYSNRVGHDLRKGTVIVKVGKKLDPEQVASFIRQVEMLAEEYGIV